MPTEDLSGYGKEVEDEALVTALVTKYIQYHQTFNSKLAAKPHTAKHHKPTSYIETGAFMMHEIPY